MVRMRTEKVGFEIVSILKSVIFWSLLAFIIYLFIDAVFFTPLIETDWGFTNQKLETVIVLCLGCLTISNWFNIKKIEKGGLRK